MGDPPAPSLLSCRVEEGTAFQRKETEFNCRLKIFMSELYRPGLSGPFSPTIVPQKYLALYSILPGPESRIAEVEGVDEFVSLSKVANA
jgi:hypothetical protein